jgi:hypothetical protein
MKQASQALDFERAAELRDRIHALERHQLGLAKAAAARRRAAGSSPPRGDARPASSPITGGGAGSTRIEAPPVDWLRVLRFVTLMLAALSLTMESAHVLELPQKMRYDAALYSAVNTTLYRYFAIVGAVYQVGSIAAAALLAFALRGGGRGFRWALTGALCLVAAFVVWLTVVAPVNAEVAAAIASDPASVPALWMRLRDRWEYGHAAGFADQVVGFAALVVSLLVETPDHADDRRHRR